MSVGISQVSKDDLYIELCDGTKWYPSRTDNTVAIATLAHSLGNLCRFTGHCKQFYSIAEHSVKVSRIVPTLTALMHDAHEIVCNDLAKPTKVFIGGSYGELEDSCERQIASQYGLEYPHPVDVKRADVLMVLIESRDLLPSGGRGWGYYEEFQHEASLLHAQCPQLTPDYWEPVRAAQEFLERYRELGGK